MGDDLSTRLRTRVRANGPLTFAEFMDAALYDADEGFFARAVVGERGDFVTAPHLSPLFGALVARQVEDFWLLLGQPDPFEVIECGAGDGTLGRQILESLLPPLSDAVRYTAVDRSAAAREALSALSPDHPRVRVAADLADVPRVDTGVVVANELLDNLPVHRVLGTPEGLMELRVGLDEDGRFVTVDGGPPADEVAALTPPGLRPGEERAVSPGAVRFLDTAVAALRRGYVWVIDYAAGDDVPTPVHGYLGQRWTDDVLTDPGSRDITAGVDLGALAARARAAGRPVWGPVSQREALLALGFRELDDRAQARQLEAVAARRGIEALRISSNRSRANLLLGRGGMGEFQVLCVGVDAEGVPRSMRSPGERG